MAGIQLPGEDQLPPGRLRDLVTALHVLYRGAGRPGLRTIASAVMAGDFRDTVSHEKISAMLHGEGLPRWSKLEAVVRQLATWHTPRLDPDWEAARFLAMWEAADPGNGVTNSMNDDHFEQESARLEHSVAPGATELTGADVNRINPARLADAKMVTVKQGRIDSALASTEYQSVIASSHDRDLIIGISLSRERADAVLANLDVTQIIAQGDQALADTSPGDVVRAVTHLVDVLCNQAESGQTVAGLGVTLAGVVGSSSGTVYYAPDLQTKEHPWDRVSLGADIREALRVRAWRDMRVAVENDANSLAVYEYLRHDGNTGAIVIVRESGEGIGAGLVINGDIAHGADGASGEIGHVIVDPNGKRCRCGANGCVETVASAAAIIKAFDEKTCPEPVRTLQQASDLAERGDRAAREIFANAGEALGRTISHFMTIMAPPRLIAFGPPQLMHYAEIGSARAFLEGVRRGRSTAILGPKSDLVSTVLYPTTLATAAAAMAVRYCHLCSR